MKRLVIEHTGFGVRGAVLEERDLLELIDADALGDWVTDALFVGRADAVDVKLNAAFLDCGLAQHAFLGAKDARHLAGEYEKRPIGRFVRQGDRVVVQGMREPVEGKGARVTTDVKLFGFHMIYRPHGTPPESAPVRGRERVLLQERGERLFPQGGVTLRKLAGEVDDATLEAELARLEGRWRAMEREAAEAKRPGRLTADEHAVERLLRGLVEPGLRRIEVADEELFARCRALLEGPLAPHGIELVRLDARQGAFEQTDVEDAVARALAREAPLRGGGRLLIEPTSACTAIDVDGEGREALDLNLDAAREIARQLRLRNLGGTVIVDFVDLPTKPQRQRLEEGLKRAFRDDPVAVQIYPMSPLGIVQLSRARRGRSLDALLRGICRHCEGTGREPSLRAAAEELLGGLRRGSSGLSEVRVGRDLLLYLEKELGEGLRPLLGGARLVIDPGQEPGGFSFGGD
ncbi:ribonuclease E/G [Marinimicrococcus flavescens]|uniref:Ribonuclease E/G n=1 Tax=Marinimicrococcus flavescens TaxID=3031815 RepID=A0AAP3XRQ4_9PROT|nr:ribonuclease E/G [Marinimicrococcus flavescens]